MFLISAQTTQAAQGTESSYFPSDLVRPGIVLTDKFFKLALINGTEPCIQTAEDLEVAVALK